MELWLTDNFGKCNHLYISICFIREKDREEGRNGRQSKGQQGKKLDGARGECSAVVAVPNLL